MKKASPLARYLPLLAFLSAIVGCGNDSAPGATTAKKPAAPAIVVERASATLGPVFREIEHSGTLKALREVRIISQEEGMITALPRREGDRVDKGELLVQLDDRLLQAELSKTSAQRRDAELAKRRLVQLQKSRAVSEEELAQAGTTVDVARAEEQMLRTRLDHTHITAPFAGIITARMAEVGDAVPRFSHILTLIDPGSLYTELQLSEVVLPALQPGDEVSVRIDALGNRHFRGEVLRIHPVVDPQSRQGIVEVLLTPLPEGALAGQLCRVTLRLQLNDRLTIPYSALRRDLQGEFVFTIDGAWHIHRTAVTSGLHLGEQVEIISGLKADQQVVSKGFLGLAEGSTVRLASDTQTPTP